MAMLYKGWEITQAEEMTAEDYEDSVFVVDDEEMTRKGYWATCTYEARYALWADSKERLQQLIEDDQS